MKRLAPLLLLGCAACTTVGPSYTPPAAPPAHAWMEKADTGSVTAAWWKGFDDPMLTRLVEQALTSAPDVQVAQARLDEVRANRDAVLGGHLPKVQASGSVTANKISRNGQFPVSKIPGFDTNFNLFDVGFDASWEIDFWGRKRRKAQGANARVGAAEAQRDGVLVTLAGEVARDYFDLRQAQQSAVQARNVALLQDDLARLTKLRFTVGEASQLELDQANAAAANARQAVPQAEAQVSAAAYRIAALLGVAPEKIVPQLLEGATLPQAPHTVLVGMRSDLLRRRPDVRAAERNLAAATADVGVATADLFPRFSLMGGLGQQGRSGSDLFDGGSTRFSIGPSFSWPIFDRGAIHAKIRAADARTRAAEAQYTKVVAGALADSESAINRFAHAQQVHKAAEQQLKAQQHAFKLANLRFKRGEDDKLAHDRARLALVAAQQQAVVASGAQDQAAVALYKALGGAWQAAPEAKPAGGE